MFNNDERYIRKHFGKKNPFVVPKGYFDGMAARVMKSVEPTETGTVAKTSTIVTISPWKRYRKAVVGIAASVCVAMFSLGVYFHGNDADKAATVAARQATAVQASTEYSALDEAVDYSMMDADDMYAYMADLN